MFVAEVASRLDAAVKALDAIDGASFIKYLLGDCIVGTEMERRGLVGWTVGVGIGAVGAVSGVDVKST
jgi:hypothetical protein